jgi:hypothetical protein
MQLFLNLFIYTDTIHVSGGSSAHHQEHVTVHIASGIFNQLLLLAATVDEMFPPQTCRAYLKINKFKKSCILLAVICNCGIDFSTLYVASVCQKVLPIKCVFCFYNKDGIVDMDLRAGRQDTTSIIIRILVPC